MRINMKRLIYLLWLFTFALCVFGCGTDNSSYNATADMSRVTLYQSVDDMFNDSDLVVIGTVQNTSVVQDIDDITDFTLSDVFVEQTIFGDSVNKNMITVRQTGSSEQQTGESFMSPGDCVLLFLVHSGLDGELADQYYITGATAGWYELNAVDDMQLLSTDSDNINYSQFSFERVDMDSGDTLPSTLSPDELMND